MLPCGIGDISLSAVERNIGPDATIAVDFINRLSNIVKDLNIYPNNMKKNLDITNGIFSLNEFFGIDYSCFTGNNLIKLFKGTPCKHGRKTPHL